MMKQTPQSRQNIPKPDELSDSLSFCHFAQKKKRSFDIPFGHPAPPPNSQTAANTVFIVSELEAGWWQAYSLGRDILYLSSLLK